MNMYNSYSFNALEKGLDYLWQKQRMSQQNIANYDTPGYKSKEVKFCDVLADNEKQMQSMDKNRYKSTIITDDDTSIRPDGNNVNMEKENINLWKSYAQYSYLSQKITSEFKNMRYVINQSVR